MNIRSNFLFRFTVVTLVSAVVVAILLGFTLDSLHRRAIENDAMVAALGRIDARLAGPLSRYPGAAGSASVRAELAAATAEATLDPFVSGVRVYEETGRAVLGSGPAAEARVVHEAATSDGFVKVDIPGGRTVLQPFAAGRGRFVLAIDFARAQMEAQVAREGRPVALAAMGGIALVFLSLVTLAAGASRELERRRRESRTTFVETLVALAEAIDLRDPYTAGHSKRVAEYSRKLGAELGLDEGRVENIEQGALLHDIGKVGVPDAVLFKNGPLDAHERHLIQRHPVVGARLIEHIPCAENVTPCVLHHHERVDGSGYPAGLIGDQIPLGARIIAVADAFDAMTTDRPYRRALDAETAVERLVAGVGTQFDGRCVAAFAGLVLSGAIVPPPSTGTVVFGQRPMLELLTAI